MESSLVFTLRSDDGCVMFDQVMTWYNMEYADVVQLERALGEGVLQSTLALGDARVAGGAAAAAAPRK